MKSAIIYYSYSGNTRKVAGVLFEHLRQKSEIEVIELKAQDESSNFFGQAARAFWHTKARIDNVKIDLSEYDLVYFGTPVWAFGPAPAMNTYLDECYGLEGKDVIVFVTYGSGAGKERCMNYMEDILTKKGAKLVRRFSIQQSHVNDKDFVLSHMSHINIK